MNPLILMGAIVIAPTLLILILRVKAALVFMSLCVGLVLSKLVGDTALDLVQLFVKGYNPATKATVEIGLLLAPALLSLLFLMHTLGKGKFFLNLFPAILTGVMLLLLVVPILPDGTKYSITGTNIWQQLTQYQAALVSVAAFISLSQLWAGGQSMRSKHGKHKR